MLALNTMRNIYAFLAALRGHTPGRAIEDVRARVMRQLDHQPGLRRHFLNTSQLRPEVDEDGAVTQALHTRPDSARLNHVLSNYARGLHAWSTGTSAPPNALLSIERIFHMQTRSSDYWEPILAARDFAATGTIMARGVGGEFRLAFRELRAADLLSAMLWNSGGRSLTWR
jgi:hypothetical protein